jgi:glucose/mannose transport system permease protein
MKTKFTISTMFIYLALIGAAIFFFTPAWFALMNSFKPLAEINQGNVLGIPSQWTFLPWIEAWSTACTGRTKCEGLLPYFQNSLIVTIPATIISTLWGSFNGYLLAKWRFKGGDAVLFLLMFGTFVPAGLFLLPLSIIFHKLALSDSLMGLVIVHTIYSLPIALFFRNYFLGFPGELIKAARIDGAGLLTIFWHIVFPTAKPILVVVAIMQFTAIWNDFLFALVLAPSDLQLVTVGLNNLVNVQDSAPHPNTYMAAAIIAAVPTTLIYLVAGKYFVRGLTSGAVKG